MNTYLVAGIPYSGELYHHGIKGQKWGIRRFQNEDGSLTSAGVERYGSSEGIGKYAGNRSVARRFLTGDFTFGAQRERERREKIHQSNADMYNEAYKKEVERNKAEGRSDAASRGREANLLGLAANSRANYEAQRARNIDYEKYLSNTSTGKLAVQNFLLSGIGADRYRMSRSRGSGRARAMVDTILSDQYGNSLIGRYSDAKKYGRG